jgi:hypothetical protein
MSGLVDEIKARAPKLRGRLAADAPIAEATWFRARIVAALAKRGDAVDDRVYNGPIRWN